MLIARIVLALIWSAITAAVTVAWILGSPAIIVGVLLSRRRSR